MRMLMHFLLRTYTKVHLISRLNARAWSFLHEIKCLFELHDQDSESMNFTLLHDFARTFKSNLKILIWLEYCMIIACAWSTLYMHAIRTKLCMLHECWIKSADSHTLDSGYHYKLMGGRRWKSSAALPFSFLHALAHIFEWNFHLYLYLHVIYARMARMWHVVHFYSHELAPFTLN